MKWYGSITNRIEEKAKSLQPQVGLDVTEYLWSDCHAYYITEVINPKHFIMKRYQAKHIGAFGENNWDLQKDPNSIDIEVVYRYGNWYQAVKYTKESIERCEKEDGYVLLDQKTYDKAMEKGVAYKYEKLNIVIGAKCECYDFEF